jgi:glycosyltransferase involved in cell wall biosynthesis
MFKVLTFFPFVTAREAGGDRSFIEIIKRWSLSGNQIHVVTTYMGYALLKQNHVDFFPHLFRAPNQQKNWKEFLGSHTREIIQFLHIPEEKFDFIYCPSEMIGYIVPAFLAKAKLKIPLVIEFQSLPEHELNFCSSLKYLTLYENRPFLRPIAVSFDTMIRNFLAKKADLILALSDYDKNLLCKMGLYSKRIRTVKRGINYDQIKMVNVSGKFFDGCFLGRIIPRKGIWDLIEAWKKVVEYMPSSRLAIIGDGPREVCNKLDSVIKNLGMSQNIIRFGWVSGDNKYAIMKRSKLFIFPSYSEAFPLSVCEAMACQLPVISYDLPQFREHYPQGMIRVKKGNVEKLSSVIKVLLKNQNLREKFSKDASEQAKKLDWNIVAREELEIISEFFN